MKNGPLFFLGLFAALGLSWAGLALGTHAQIGGLTPYFDEAEGRALPDRAPGVASRGAEVYADLGCAACHTQQVRRPGFGSDKDRGWGERQSVARDYIHQAQTQLGQTRLGPDLANFGARVQGSNETEKLQQIYTLLYNGVGAMPSYKFLFEDRPSNLQPSPKAVARASTYEVVPSVRAEELAAYLLSLNQAHTYPEAAPLPEPKADQAKEGGHK